MTDARPLNQHTTSDAGLDPRSLVGVASDLCRLPAVATQDWAELAAGALTGVDDACRVGVLITDMDDAGHLRTVDSASVSVSDLEARRSQDPKKLANAARIRLERLSHLGLALPPESIARGLAAHADELGDWRSGPLSRVWEPHNIESLLVVTAPVGAADGAEPDPARSTRRTLVGFIALAQGSANATRPGPRTLGALLPLLAERATLAMPADQEIGWLTDREQDVLDRLTLGRSVREIAEDLERSPHTVHDHVKSLHRKLSASSRGELVARALGHNPVPPARLDPVIIGRVRASTLIEPSPGLARRVPAS
ncbi:MAG: helix-turn-helix transcriptional regulator [Planctomycetota bacterium]